MTVARTDSPSSSRCRIAQLQFDVLSGMRHAHAQELESDSISAFFDNKRRTNFQFHPHPLVQRSHPPPPAFPQQLPLHAGFPASTAATMANEQSGNPLRRWRPFYGAFGAIDDAIEGGGHPRAAFRDARVRILRLLRAATDDGVAEQLCCAHDDAMVEALKTLLVTPVPHGLLASTDLEKTIGALRNHDSSRIRSLASDVLREWKMAAAVKKVVSKMEAKKPVAAQNEKMHVKKQPIITQREKIETAKRKLHEGYEEAKMVKRQHKIEDKEALKMFEHSQLKMHRAPARCRTSSGVRRSLLPSLLV